MAFEIMAAKREARKARREAIEALDKHIGILTVGLLNESDPEKRKAAEQEIAGLATIRECLKKKQDLPKWANTAIETLCKAGGVVLLVVMKEKMMNTGTGDKIISDGMSQMMR